MKKTLWTFIKHKHQQNIETIKENAYPIWLSGSILTTFAGTAASPISPWFLIIAIAGLTSLIAPITIGSILEWKEEYQEYLKEDEES